MPRHRAQRRIENPNGRVRVNAAVAAARSALEDASPAEILPDWETAADTEPLPAIAVQPGPASPAFPAASAFPASTVSPAASPFPAASRAPDLPRGPVSPRGPGGPAGPGRAPRSRRMSGVARGLLVTPWFAASTGLVIAAALWLHAPHAELTFPNQIVHCPGPGCPVHRKPAHGSLATTRPGERIGHKLGPKAGHRDAAPDVTSGLTFRFTVLPHQSGSFAAAITIYGKRSLGSWQLRFRLPGTLIQSVAGARWRLLRGGDGVVARASQLQFSRHDDNGGVRFVVFASGTVTAPTGCSYDHMSCTFIVSSLDSSQGSGGGQGFGGGQGDQGQGGSGQGLGGI